MTSLNKMLSTIVFVLITTESGINEVLDLF